jgi:hypothetical protein
MTTPRISAALLGAALALLTAQDAQAFVQTTTCVYESGTAYSCGPGEDALPVHWARRCVQYKVNRLGSADIATGADGELSEALLTTIRASFDAWSQATCSNFHMEYTGLSDESLTDFDRKGGIAGNENLVTWLDEWPYDRAAYALTSVTFNANDGRIQDADIELNDDIYQFTDTNLPGTIVVDVRNTLTHEVGHFLGLDHSSDAEATMYFSAREGETKKRSLAQDDLEGLCTIYPNGEGELSCTKDEASPSSGDEEDATCASVGAASALPGLWTLFAALFGWGGARRRRRA